MYTDPACNPNVEYGTSSTASAQPKLRELWDEALVDQLSRHDRVQKLVVLGMPSVVVCKVMRLLTLD